MTQTQEKHCGRDVEYDFGNKTGACGSATRSGVLKCEDCRAADANAAEAASANAEPETSSAAQ